MSVVWHSSCSSGGQQFVQILKTLTFFAGPMCGVTVTAGGKPFKATSSSSPSSSSCNCCRDFYKRKRLEKILLIVRISVFETWNNYSMREQKTITCFYLYFNSKFFTSSKHSFIKKWFHAAAPQSRARPSWPITSAGVNVSHVKKHQWTTVVDDCGRTLVRLWYSDMCVQNRFTDLGI